MLSAMPDTTWLPPWVTQAKPCTRLTTTDAAIAAPSPAQADPVTAAVAAAANAEASILASRPMSTTPERSAKSPPSPASTSGVASRAVAAGRRRPAPPGPATPRSFGPLARAPERARCRPGPAPPQQGRDRPLERVLERAAHEDDEPLDDHHHVAGEPRHVERQLGATL